MTTHKTLIEDNVEDTCGNAPLFRDVALSVGAPRAAVPRWAHAVLTLGLLSSSYGCDEGDGPRLRARVRHLERELSACQSSHQPGPEPQAEIAALFEPTPAPPPVASPMLWDTSELADSLTGRPVVMRSIRSRDSFTLGAPYQGAQYAHLTLRRHPRFGNDVYVRIERGQLMCDFMNCRVDVVFDDGEPIRWRADRSVSGTSEIMFLRQFDRFERLARNAREIRIAVTLYGDGSRTFVFPGLAAREGEAAGQW